MLVATKILQQNVKILDNTADIGGIELERLLELT